MLEPSSTIEVETSYYLTDNPLFDVCKINGSLFAIFHSAINSKKEINLEFDEYSVVFLSPFVANNDIHISGINTIFLNNMTALNGKITIQASGHVIALGTTFEAFGGHDVEAQLEIICHSLSSARLEEIRQMFQKAVTGQDGDLVVDALLEVVDAAVDPLEEYSNDEIAYADAFNFLGILY